VVRGGLAPGNNGRHNARGVDGGPPKMTDNGSVRAGGGRGPPSWAATVVPRHWWLLGTIDRWLLGVGDGGLLHGRWPAGGMEGGGAGGRTAVAVAQATAAATVCGAGTCGWFCCVSAGAWARVAFG
jgi:hypothetical protein